jgi:hypothetical protein
VIRRIEATFNYFHGRHWAAAAASIRARTTVYVTLAPGRGSVNVADSTEQPNKLCMVVWNPPPITTVKVRSPTASSQTAVEGSITDR